MPKLLFYNHTGQVSGAEKVLLFILARLDRTQFAPVLLCPATGPLTQMARQLDVPGHTAPKLEARFTWRPGLLAHYLRSLVSTMRALRRQIREISPSLIHANSIRAGLVATVATIGSGVPVIWHIHDLLPRHPFSVAIRWCVWLTSRARVLAVSQAAATRFCGWLLCGRRVPVRVLRNVVDTERFQYIPEARAALRAELGLADDAFVVGSLGQITPRKGQLELLQAFAGVCDKLPDAVLVIVGAPLFNQDHLYQECLRQAADELGLAGRVYFPGPRTDVPALFSAFDLFVLNSQSEAFSLVILEAMACGTPVIATAVGGTPEIVVHHCTGWLIPPQDGPALARTLVEAYAQPEMRQQFAARTRQLIRDEFTPAVYLAELEKFYEEAFGVPPGEGFFAPGTAGAKAHKVA